MGPEKELTSLLLVHYLKELGELNGKLRKLLFPFIVKYFTVNIDLEKVENWFAFMNRFKICQDPSNLVLGRALLIWFT